MRRSVAATRRVLAGLLLWSAACATPPPAPQDDPATPLAWRATRSGDATDFYLLGSIHVGVADPRPLHPRILDAFARSDALVVEIDLAATPPTEIGRALLERAVLEDGRALPEVVSEATWRELRAWLAERGMAEASVLHLEPWAVYLKVTQALLSEQGYEADRGVDQRFIRAAHGEMPIVGLETAALQFDVFDGFGWKHQEALLRGVLEAEPGGEADAAELFRAWERGDEGALERYFFAAAEGDPVWQEIHERLFFERNERMARDLDALADDGRTRFVVVGAGHMVGPRGIPALLAARGFRVQRLTGAGLP